ncbi:MAG: hypothetical protein ACTS22_07440 [Phycisphaerales bacterium]
MNEPAPKPAPIDPFDALAALAEGRIRLSDLQPHELESLLKQTDLETVLDAIFDGFQLVEVPPASDQPISLVSTDTPARAGLPVPDRMRFNTAKWRGLSVAASLAVVAGGMWIAQSSAPMRLGGLSAGGSIEWNQPLRGPSGFLDRAPAKSREVWATLLSAPSAEVIDAVPPVIIDADDDRSIAVFGFTAYRNGIAEPFAVFAFIGPPPDDDPDAPRRWGPRELAAAGFSSGLAVWHGGASAAVRLSELGEVARVELDSDGDGRADRASDGDEWSPLPNRTGVLAPLGISRTDQLALQRAALSALHSVSREHGPDGPDSGPP